jgi:hypothetical protein
VWKREPPDADAILERMREDREELALQNLPIHDSDWDPLCPVEIAMRAKFFSGKAAGPDGWSGNEIATMPIAVFVFFAKFCQLCEASGLLPSTWQIARQTHLPKGQKGVRAHDSARDVSGLRPLTLFSAWYRLCVSARLKSDSCQKWISTWWPAQAAGGKQGRELYDALFPLIEAVTQGQFVVSLDFSLAFDYGHPDIAIPFPHNLGLPISICSMLHKQWTNQRRYLSFENFVWPDAELVSSSLPQGDPWSLLAMIALLTPATWEIARRHPSATLKTFVDDRTWATRSVTEALQIETIWASWSRDLQLKENTAKSQYFHPQQKGRNEFIDRGVPVNQVSHDIVVLGHTFRGFLQRKISHKEDERINQAVVLIRRATWLPVSFAMHKQIIAAAPLSKAEFGWMLKVPTLAICKKVQNAIKQALHEPLYASPNLRNLLRGHRLNINFRIAQYCIGAVRRCLAKSTANVLYAWHKSFGVGPAITQLLKRFSWSYHGPWVWKHDLTNDFLALHKAHPSYEAYTARRRDDLTCHASRNSFRAHELQAWKNTSRKDATFCQNIDYNAERCKLAVNLAKNSRHNFAILSVAFVSDAALAVHKRTAVKPCPFCNSATADTDHAFWTCRDFPPPVPRPLDCMLRRLGWPRVGHPNDTAVVSWMCEVRKRTLDKRHRPDA